MLKEIEFDTNKLKHTEGGLIWAEAFTVGVSNEKGEPTETLDRIILFIEIPNGGIIGVNLVSREKASRSLIQS